MFPPLFPPLKQLCSRQSLTCLVTVFCFVTTSVGFPLEPVGMPHAGCQCGQELQRTGGCCCSRAQTSRRSESPSRACCVTKQATSCCAGKAKPGTSETPATNLVSACSCGHGTADGMLINDDPRLPAHTPLIQSSNPLEFCCPPFASVFIQHCSAPETPPPELCRL
ncbi:hypothetical protein [Gimesia sp.]|uniref:hypothetical protein n=1 Tax=Gimesia sp. TaxID=2024833 RepID=UPI000C4749A4|nr:hypothetical protein [Gimesia sp.]MAX39606.1 hypothetical protein [Gimesia sp.]HBL43472.1 hypothetical protein [Planctomycetaceae bacterium]